MASVHSPPKSHEEGDLVMTDVNAPAATLSPVSNTTATKRTGTSRSDVNGIDDKSTSEASHGEPGSAWSTKKFAEDYERAFNQLQDQQWSMVWRPPTKKEPAMIFSEAIQVIKQQPNVIEPVQKAILIMQERESNIGSVQYLSPWSEDSKNRTLFISA